MGTVALRATGLVDGARDGRRVGNGLRELDGSAIGELEGNAADTIGVRRRGDERARATLGPGVDQPPSGKDVPPVQAATDRITTGSRRSGRIAGRDRMCDSLGSATVEGPKTQSD